jgi:PAS domain S-box-containing protein
MMQNEGYRLLDVLVTSSRHSITAYAELENALRLRLFNCLGFIDALEREDVFAASLPATVTGRMSLDCVAVYTENGRCTDIQGIRAPIELCGQAGVQEELRDFLSGSEDSLDIGMRRDPSTGALFYMAALRRGSGGAIMAAVSAARLDSLRRETGPGRLIQDIGNQSGITYVVLQDTSGILMASRGVDIISRITYDPFLHLIALTKTRGARMTRYKDRDVFEIAGPFIFQENAIGILRIGLSAEYYRHIMVNARYRLFFIPPILILAAVISISYILAHQDVRLISASYRREKIQSGRILENLEDAVIALSPDGKIAVFNRAAEALFGRSRQSVLGKYPEEADFVCADVLGRSRSTREGIHKEDQSVEVLGQVKIITYRTSIIKGEGEGSAVVIMVATDRSAQHRLEEALRRREKLTAMGKLASGVAHEIRNPLNAIGMIAQRLYKEFRPSGKKREYLELVRSMRDEIARTSEIIHRFLQFTRPRPLQRQTVQLGDFLQKVEKIFRSSTKNKNVSLTLSVQGVGEVMLDPEQMKQALLNILVNALEATPAGGCIQISGRVDEGMAEIAVRDSGRGIRPEDLDRIFDLYFSTTENGTGMGLPIVYQIIQAHGGDIHVESSPGHGASFYLRIPGEMP